MDSQHRHELQQNDLRKLTTKAVPFVEKYGWQIIGALVAVAVIFAVSAYWFSESTASTAESWAQFDRVLHQPNADAGDFAELAEKHPGSAAAAWARLKEADDLLKSGLREAFTNRDVSQSELKSGLEAYQKLADGGKGVTPEIRERALFGLARCQEAMSDGKVDDAVATYQRLLKDFPQTIFQSIANERIKALESPQAKDFYAWFQQQKPQPKDPHQFPFKKPAGNPDGGDDVMDESADDTDADAKPSEPAGETKDAEAAPVKTDDAAKPDAEKSAETDANKPETEKPDAPKPDSESKPAEGAEKTDSP